MIQDFHPEDRDYLTRMLGSQELPANVTAEYITLRRMAELCHRKSEALGFSECRSLLRRLGYGAPVTHSVCWRTVEVGTKILVEEPGKPAWVGPYYGTINIGRIGVRDGEKVVSLDQRHCRPWEGEDVSKTHDELAQWRNLPVDTPVRVTRQNGETADGLFKAVVGERLQVQVGDKPFNYAPRSVEVAELVEV